MTAPPPFRDRWRSEAVAGRYATERFASSRARDRDPRLLQRLLRRAGTSLEGSRVLDVPCGTGRLAPWLAGSQVTVEVDVSLAMLRHAPPPRLLADAFSLPFADGAFEIVVCCRLLHHLDPVVELPSVVRELVRVSCGLVLASFWDSATLPALRRRLGRRARSARRPVSRRTLEACFETAGARVFHYVSSAPLLSMQTFAAARVGG